MTTEIKVPMLPESIADATISTWHKKIGDAVSRDENLMDLETDKVMLEVPSPVDGVLKEIIRKSGDVVHANEVVAIVEEGATAKPSVEKETSSKAASSKDESATKVQSTSGDLSPSVRRAVAERDLDVSQIKGTGKGGRIIKENLETPVSSAPMMNQSMDLSGRPEKRVPMTRIRARIAERLLEVKQNTAMLTTFNEINLQQVMDLRNKYKDKFEKSHNTRLGFMSFFVKAAV
jgi:2-oxoglutarate dehydrogenase E2 component (dihydrolipoamide succinyltransferase)